MISNNESYSGNSGEEIRENKELYHGGKHKFEEFKTPSGEEEMDVTKGGVIYLTSDLEVAKKYAGPDGYVCIAEVDDAASYKEQRDNQGLPKKESKYVRNVYVALPTNIRIKQFISVRDLK